MKPPEPWVILLDKVRQDEYVVDKLLGLADSPDEVIGFHLQQAAEKLLKAALLALGIRYRFTHNLGELIHLLAKGRNPLPRELDGIRELTPYATEWRYDLLPPEGEEPLDRLASREMVARLRTWVEGIIRLRKAD
jgi:HEPN domain-containing protein